MNTSLSSSKSATFPTPESFVRFCKEQESFNSAFLLSNKHHI